VTREATLHLRQTGSAPVRIGVQPAIGSENPHRTTGAEASTSRSVATARPLDHRSTPDSAPRTVGRKIPETPDGIDTVSAGYVLLA